VNLYMGILLLGPELKHLVKKGLHVLDAGTHLGYP
jgi:hypothetical protein